MKVTITAVDEDDNGNEMSVTREVSDPRDAGFMYLYVAEMLTEQVEATNEHLAVEAERERERNHPDPVARLRKMATDA